MSFKHLIPSYCCNNNLLFYKIEKFLYKTLEVTKTILNLNPYKLSKVFNF